MAVEPSPDPNIPDQVSADGPNVLYLNCDVCGFVRLYHADTLGL